MTSTEATPAPPPRWKRPLFAVLTAVVCLGVLGLMFGRRAWNDYQAYRESRRAAEDSVPIGYVGAHYRRSYNDRPVSFHSERDGRKLLFAAKLEGGEVDSYDVTDADFPVEGVSGGVGRDSVPGVDYPILEPPSGEHAQRFRARQVVHGLLLDSGPRAYPGELLAKIEVVNDRDGEAPFVVVFDQGRGRALAYSRTLDGRAITFGTTGYASDRKPLLYDRPTKSLWLPADDALVCVSGERRKTRLPVYRKAEKTNWADWSYAHPETLSLVGNDRSKPIPSE